MRTAERLFRAEAPASAMAALHESEGAPTREPDTAPSFGIAVSA